MNIQPVEFKFWTDMHDFLVRRRLGALIVATMLTGVFLSRFPAIVPDPNPTSFLPQDIPEVAFWQDLNKRFGALNNLMIGLEEPAGPLTSDGLTRVANITNGLLALKKDGVVAARSVINVESTEVDAEGTMNVDDMVPSIPMTQTGLDELAGRIRNNIQIPGAFISHDMKAYVIMVKLAEGADSGDLAGKIINVVERERGPLSSYYFGSAFATYQVSQRILDGLRWVVPVFAAGLFIVLFVGLRRPAAFLMTLLCAVIPLVWWLGTLSLLKIPVTMPVLNGALLLLTFGALAFARVAEGRSRGMPVFFGSRTMLTILVGIVAFAVVAAWTDHIDMSIPFLENFSLAMAVGFAVMAVAALLVVIPMMTLFDPAPELTAPLPDRKPAGIGMRAMAIALPAAVAAISLSFVPSLKFAVSLDDMFSKSEDVGRGVDFFDRKLGGNEILQVSVRGDFNTSAALNRLMRFTDLVEGSGQFADVRSISQIVSYVSSGLTGTYWIPPSDDQIADLYFFLEGVEDIKSLVSADHQEAMLAIRMPSGSRDRTDELMAVIADARRLSSEIGPESARARLAAIARHYDVLLPAGRIDEVLSRASGELDESARARVEQQMKTWVESDDAPWTPAPGEWDSVRKLLFGDVNELARVIAAQPSYIEQNADSQDEPAELAERIAESIEFKIKAAIIETRSSDLADALVAGLQSPPNFRVRAHGILASLLAPVPEGSQQLEFTISGYPAFTRQSSERMLNGLLMSAMLLFLVAASYVLLRGLRNPARLAVLPVGAAAAASTFALSGVLGLHADPNSATVFLIAPMAWVFMSECLNDITGATTRYPMFFALALAAGAASLMMFGVMPIVRMGAAMAMSLGITAILLYVFRSMWFRTVPESTKPD